MGKRQEITRLKSDHDRRERMHVEFVNGGPLDGARVILDVVWDGPKEIRVLEASYTKTERVPLASEVDSA